MVDISWRCTGVACPRLDDASRDANEPGPGTGQSFPEAVAMHIHDISRGYSRYHIFCF